MHVSVVSVIVLLCCLEYGGIPLLIYQGYVLSIGTPGAIVKDAMKQGTLKGRQGRDKLVFPGPACYESVLFGVKAGLFCLSKGDGTLSGYLWDYPVLCGVFFWRACCGLFS